MLRTRPSCRSTTRCSARGFCATAASRKSNCTCARLPKDAVARYIVLFAQTDPERGARGISAFLLDTERAGFHCGKSEPKLGIRASATCEIELDDYIAAPDEVLGAQGQGFKIAMGVLDSGRIGIAAQAIGIARAAKIADMKCKLDCALLLTLRAAWLKTRGKPHTSEAAIAKLTASEAAMWITHQVRTRRCRFTVAWAIPENCHWSAISAMPRLPRFMRAPVKSSGW